MLTIQLPASSDDLQQHNRDWKLHHSTMWVPPCQPACCYYCSRLVLLLQLLLHHRKQFPHQPTLLIDRLSASWTLGITPGGFNVGLGLGAGFFRFFLGLLPAAAFPAAAGAAAAVEPSAAAAACSVSEATASAADMRLTVLTNRSLRFRDWACRRHRRASTV